MTIDNTLETIQIYYKIRYCTETVEELIMTKKKMYQKAVVTFIDILGFGELVKKSDCNKVIKILDAVQKATSPKVLDDLTDKYDHAEVISFSDSIVRVRNIESEANKKYPSGLFFQEIHNLVIVQGELIDFDIIIRGSVSIGDVFISKDRVFGPGLIKAYELESKYAKYPRIIIDPELIREYKINQLLKAKWHSIEQDQESVKKLLRQGDDGMWFVDYARAIEDMFDEPETYLTFIQRHKEVILAGAKSHEKLNNILSKFIWMAYYHNQIISDFNDGWFVDNELDKDDFLISSAELPALQYVEP